MFIKKAKHQFGAESIFQSDEVHNNVSTGKQNKHYIS